MRFPYQKLVVKDSHQKIHIAFRPLIPLYVSKGEKRFLSYGLVDSGADVCLFESTFCKKLGLKLTTGKKQTLRGVGKEEITFYLHPVNLKIGDYSVTTEIGFSDEISHIPFAILGQKGFFENFLVAFNYPKRWVEVIQTRR